MLQNLVVCGGGINIVSYIGVLTCLSEQDLLHGITNYYGTSAGGIVSVMLAIGYSVDEMKRFMLRFDFSRVVEDVDPILVFEELGLSLGTNMEIITKSVITFKLGEEKLDYTLKQLYEDRGINVSLSTYNVTKKCNVHFDRTSEVPIWQALMATCRIPLIFTPMDINGEKYIDGAVCDNFPIHLIKKEQLRQTLAIYCHGSHEATPSSGYPFIDYIYDLLGAYIDGNVNNFLEMYRPIMITVKTITAFFNFELTDEQKQKMLDIGYNTAKERLPDIQQFWEVSSVYVDSSTQTD
jgi:NTE family protein